MRRYLVLALLYTLNTITFHALGSLVPKAHKLFHKPFIFKTPFGTFLGTTVNHRTVLIPNYEPEIQAVIKQNIAKTKHQSEKIFLNIGSHIGRYAIELAKKYDYTCYCFEPSPETFKTLKINTLLSEVQDKFHLYNFCLGDKDGMTLFEYVDANDASSKMAGDGASTDKTKFIEVPVKRFDNLGLNITPDLIIMDVEGFEYEVLQGMEQFIKSLPKTTDIIIEIMPHTPTKKQTLELMESWGFTYKWADDHDAHFQKA